ncbi:MAG: recombinase family protein [Firmicutes bacterium]|nr:recombinase family protein [Bacillota bacterium]
MKNAVIYARYSPGANQTYQSIEGQLAECLAFCQRSGLRITHQYIDCAQTGTNDKRTEFLRMIEDSKRRGFAFVVVYQLDRFARNRYDSATYKAKLKKNGVRVLSARENITDDASGVLIEGVLESMAEYYSVELSQKIKRGFSVSASKCKYFGGSVPLGYKVNEQKEFVLDEEKAPIVQKLFEMFTNGHNYAQILRWLNERGIMTTRGKKWGSTNLHDLFGNRRYLGIYIYKGSETVGGMPRIIDDETFAEAQRVLARYSAAPSRGKATVDYILSAKMICGHCGTPLNGVSATSKNKRTHYYYQCAKNRKTGKCGNRALRKQFLEDGVLTAIVGDGTEQNRYGILTDENIDILAAETYLLIQAERNDTEIKRLESIVAENQKAINNLMQALMLGRIAETLLTQIERLETENKELSGLIAYEKSMQIDYSYDDIRKWLLRFRTLDYSKAKHRKDLIDALIYKVIVYDNKMKILFHLKGGQQRGELLLNLIFPDYPDGGNNGGDSGNSTPKNGKEESDLPSSCSAGCSPAHVMVEVM